jgi:hypothetical protein
VDEVTISTGGGDGDLPPGWQPSPELKERV